MRAESWPMRQHVARREHCTHSEIWTRRARRPGGVQNQRLEDRPMPNWAEQVTAVATAVSAIGLLSAVGAAVSWLISRRLMSGIT